MSPGFDARVEARLIGLRMASDGMTATVATPGNDILSIENADKPSSSDRNSVGSSISTNQSSSSSNSSFSANAPITARRYNFNNLKNKTSKEFFFNCSDYRCPITPFPCQSKHPKIFTINLSKII